MTAGGYVATTDEGPRCFNVRVDRATGIADVDAADLGDLESRMDGLDRDQNRQARVRFLRDPVVRGTLRLDG